MTHHLGLIYAAGAGVTALAVEATAESSPLSVALLAILAPIGPVLVGYLLTRSKLRKQDEKVQEIHVLVNSRLSKTLDALQEALVDNIALKRRLGISVSPDERQAAEKAKAALAEAGELADGVDPS